MFFAVVVLLLPVLRDGPTPARMSRLCGEFAVSKRTIGRWRRFWREAFPTSRVWAAARGRFALPVSVEDLPGSLLAAYSGLGEVKERLIAVLRLVAPSGASSALGL